MIIECRKETIYLTISLFFLINYYTQWILAQITTLLGERSVIWAKTHSIFFYLILIMISWLPQTHKWKN